jgi:hypothetical protein
MAVSKLKGFSKFTTGSLYFILSIFPLAIMFRVIPDPWEFLLVYFCVRLFIIANNKTSSIWFPKDKK